MNVRTHDREFSNYSAKLLRALEVRLGLRLVLVIGMTQDGELELVASPAFPDRTARKVLAVMASESRMRPI